MLCVLNMICDLFTVSPLLTTKLLNVSISLMVSFYFPKVPVLFNLTSIHQFPFHRNFSASWGKSCWIEGALYFHYTSLVTFVKFVTYDIVMFLSSDSVSSFLLFIHHCSQKCVFVIFWRQVSRKDSSIKLMCAILNNFHAYLFDLLPFISDKGFI